MRRFLVDAQLPPALARWIAEQGCEALHIGDLGLESASDRQIWLRAQADGGTIVTKDSLFATILELAPRGPAVVWLKFPNLRRRQLITVFATVWPKVLAAMDRGETLIEIS